MSKNIFCDYHHGDLYYSLHLLFKRFGWDLYRPIGLEWFKKGFWKIAEPYNNQPGTIGQFLGKPPKVGIQRSGIQKYGDVQLIDDVYHIPVKIGSGEYVQKAITFDKFLEMDIELVVATYLGHDEPYARLVQEYKPDAAYIRQIGNTSVQPRSIDRNVLLAINTPMPPTVNYIKYHPEHHEDYCYAPPTNHNLIKSFIADPLHQPDINLFFKYEKGLPDFTFRMHGIDGREGVISGDLMPQTIKDSAFVWHVKRTGCGGFVPRQSLACGRPCIVRKSYCFEYHTLARDLFEDSVNCIDLDLGTLKENIEKIKYFSQPDRHREMCRNTAEKFKRDVNFDEEAERIREWLNRVIDR